MATEKDVDTTQNSPKVAWLLQGAGAYWQPIISEFALLIPRTKVFTACWTGFMAGFEDSFDVEQVGTMKILSANQSSKGYSPSITYLSPGIVGHLLKFKPDIVFTTGFSIWTILAILFKILGRWKVVIVYDGSSPGVDYRKMSLRLVLRRLITRFTDAFITNNSSGKTYLIEAIGAEGISVFSRPYLVPHPKTYSRYTGTVQPIDTDRQFPVFIFVGNLIPRKGVLEFLQACSILQRQGYQEYSLWVVGDGLQRQELEAFAKQHDLQNKIRWVGAVEYELVGEYFRQADVFVFPTLEDVWGLVAVEAMMFGKPILCSKWAGAAELVADGENGYVFDPHEPQKLAELMKLFTGNPELIDKMGQKSKQIMADHAPEMVARSLAEVVSFTLDDRRSLRSP